MIYLLPIYFTFTLYMFYEYYDDDMMSVGMHSTGENTNCHFNACSFVSGKRHSLSSSLQNTTQ